MASFPGMISKNASAYFFPVPSLAPAARTTAGNGTAIDRARNNGYAALTLQLITGTWTDGTHGFVIQESDDNSTWNTVATTDLITGPGATANAFNSITSAPTAVYQSLDYIGRLRYVRVNNTVSGATTGAIFSVLGLLFSPTIYPAA